MPFQDQPQHNPDREPPRKWGALTTVALGTIMATMDASITNISFPTLTRVFDADLTVVMWVALVYTLVSTSLMLMVGKVGDLIGRKRIYALGISIFTLGLGLCALAADIETLILFRALQAVGAAMTIACGTAIVTEAFPSRERGRGLGLLGVSVSVGFICGPVLGGLLLEWLDWRSIFYMRTPIGIAAVGMAMVFLKKDRVQKAKIELDYLGTLSSSGGLFLLIYGLSRVKGGGTGPFWVGLMLGLGLLLLLVFVFIERRAKDPIVDLSLFANPVFSSAIWSLFLVFVAAPAFILIMPFYLMEGLALEPSTAGLVLAVTSLTSMGAGPVSGWLSDRFGSGLFATIGAATIALAFILVKNFDLDTQLTGIIPVLALLGLGVGAFQAPNNSVIMGSVKRRRLGTASALIATQRQVGISLGMALAGTIFTAKKAFYQTALIAQGMETIASTREAITFAFKDVLFVAILLLALAALLSLLTLRKTKSGRDRILVP
jgi:EmrB/QacA subfamily drug resistance transporter